MVDAGAEGVITSLGLFSTLIGCWLLVLIGPCRRFAGHVEAQATMSSELRKKADLKQDDVPK